MNKETYVCNRCVADLRCHADAKSALVSQLILGEPITILRDSGNWFEIETNRDQYIGYVQSDFISLSAVKSTHYVISPWALAYAEPDFTSPVCKNLPFGSEMEVVNTKVSIRPTSPPIIMCNAKGYGWVPENHLTKIGNICGDAIKFAKIFLGAPYLYGGKSILGVDCSGLVQLAFFLTGVDLPRDTSQQINFAHLTDISPDVETIPRNALIFTPGHVLLSCGNGTCVHADGISFSVIQETILEAFAKRSVSLDNVTVKVVL